ncbi:hypothetical protein JYT29_00980 [Nitrospina gracilis]|nr:hypothetical protein [Nitrospina gracilis]
MSKGFFNPILKLVGEGNTNKILDHCHSNPNPLGRIIEAGLDEKGIPRWKLEEKLTFAGEVLRVLINIRHGRDKECN